MKYQVKVQYVQERIINVHSRDEESAKEKAVEVVENWNGVVSAEAVEVVEG